MAPKIERLTDNFIVSEGPHWDGRTQSVYFVDCLGQYILRYNSTTQKITKASTAPKQANFIIPVEGKKDHFIISLNRELVIIAWDGESDNFDIVDQLVVVDEAPQTANNKFNDGKCDSTGRLWAGTFDLNRKDREKTLPVGTFYSFDSKRTLKEHVKELKLSNGLAFNEKTKKMFHIDTFKGSVDQFDFDVTNGTITNRRPWFTFAKSNVPGDPDGMTIDADGNLWVAAIGGGRIIKVDGHKPETLLETIQTAAQLPTSVTFGGPNLDELYVTSGCFERKGIKPSPPVDGALFKITGTRAKGLPANNFKLDFE